MKKIFPCIIVLLLSVYTATAQFGTITQTGNTLTIDLRQAPNAVCVLAGISELNVQVTIYGGEGIDAYNQRNRTFRGITRIIYLGTPGKDNYMNTTRIAEQVQGNEGNDTIISGLGSSDIDGGPGTNTIFARHAGVKAKNDNIIR